jgi:elongation factor G
MQTFLNAVTSMLPSPVERPISVDDKEYAADPSKPLAALVFKTAADPYVGRLTYFRVVSGTLKGDSHVWNAARNVDERLGTLYHISGKNQEHVAQITAGDIGAVAKLTDTHTGDTLSTKENPVTFPPIDFPSPSFSAAISPKTKADLDKMGSALHLIVEEDPSLRLERSPATGEMVLSGLGDSHVEVALERIKRKFSVELEMHTPRVPYRETVRAKAQAEYTHKKQTGGHGQYAKVALEVEPLPRGGGVHFENKTVGGVVPKQYIGSVEKGGGKACKGVLAHFPVVDTKVVLIDGREHHVDSSDLAFKVAASQALRQATEAAQPTLLEPVMDIRITVPETNTGDVISDLNGKRARVLGMNPAGSMTTIDAQVPLAEVQHCPPICAAQQPRLLQHGVRALRRGAISHGPEGDRPGQQGPRGRQSRARMSEDVNIDGIVDAHARAIVSMDIAKIMDDLMPEAMMKLQAQAGGGMALQINSYEIVGHSQDGGDSGTTSVHWLEVLHRPFAGQNSAATGRS